MTGLAVAPRPKLGLHSVGDRRIGLALTRATAILEWDGGSAGSVMVDELDGGTAGASMTGEVDGGTA